MRTTRTFSLTITAAFVLAVVFAACDINDPERYLRPPVIKNFLPRTPTLHTAVGDSLNFSITAVDPDEQSLAYSFHLDDSLAGTGPDWTYVVHETGDVVVCGRVSDGAGQSEIRWELTRVMPINLPPEILHVSPQEPEVTIIVGGAIDFSISATDPEGKPLSYAYAIDDSIVSVTRHYTYESTKVGDVNIRAVVTDGEGFVSHNWLLMVAAVPDSIRPAPVEIVMIEPGMETGEVNIEWVAVGDDSMTGLPSHYVVRTSPMPIDDEHAWNASSERSGEPEPAEPGTIQRMTITGLPPAKTVYVAVRARDDFGNYSAIPGMVWTKARGMTVSGTVRNAVTGEPIPGVELRLVSSTATTASDGTYLLEELPAGLSQIYVEDDIYHSDFGDFFDIVYTPYDIKDKDVRDFWMLPNDPLVTADYPDFLSFYIPLTELYGAEQNLLDTWEVPCRVHVPAFEANGLNYQQIVMDIFDEWEGYIGIDLFEFVDAEPDTGLYVVYFEGDKREHYTVTVRDAEGMQVQGRISLRNFYDEENLDVFKIIIRHEVGHAIGFNHSTDDQHIMVGGRLPSVSTPSPDEINLGKAMYNLPRGWRADWFRFD
jgi:hypothetical protein